MIISPLVADYAFVLIGLYSTNTLHLLFLLACVPPLFVAVPTVRHVQIAAGIVVGVRSIFLKGGDWKRE